MICTSRNWKLSQSQILSKDADTFLEISFFFRCYSHFFAIANQLAGFFISRLANVENFFNINIFFKCKTDHLLYFCSMLLKTSLLLSQHQDIFKTCLQDVFKTSSKRLVRCLENVFKMSSRHVMWKMKNC